MTTLASFFSFRDQSSVIDIPVARGAIQEVYRAVANRVDAIVPGASVAGPLPREQEIALDEAIEKSGKISTIYWYISLLVALGKIERASNGAVDLDSWIEAAPADYEELRDAMKIAQESGIDISGLKVLLSWVRRRNMSERIKADRLHEEIQRYLSVARGDYRPDDYMFLYDLHEIAEKRGMDLSDIRDPIKTGHIDTFRMLKVHVEKAKKAGVDVRAIEGRLEEHEQQARNKLAKLVHEAREIDMGIAVSEAEAFLGQYQDK